MFKRSLLWGMLLLAVTSLAQDKFNFPTGVPWCEWRLMPGWFKKVPAKPSKEVQFFIDALNADTSKTAQFSVNDTLWQHKLSGPDSEYVDILQLRLKVLEQKLTQEPFVDQVPSLRAQYIAYGFAGWQHGDGYRKFDMDSIPASVLSFLEKHVVGDSSFNAGDLLKILTSLNLWITYGSGPELSEKVNKLMNDEITLRRTRIDADAEWSDGFKTFVGRNGAVNNLQGLAHHAEHWAKVIEERKLPKRELRKQLLTWMKDLQKIDPVYFQSCLRIFRVFRSIAFRADFTEEDFQPLLNKFRSSIVSNWSKNPNALQAGMSELEAPLKPQALAN